VRRLSPAADRIVGLLKNEKLRILMGKKAEDAVRKTFLLGRYLEHLDLFNSFEPVYRLKKKPG
jgi:hypothetical protein